MADKKKTVRSCADCTYYSYDEEYGGYVCDVNMDEDEYVRLISDSRYACPAGMITGSYENKCKGIG